MPHVLTWDDGLFMAVLQAVAVMKPPRYIAPRKDRNEDPTSNGCGDKSLLQQGLFQIRAGNLCDALEAFKALAQKHPEDERVLGVVERLEDMTEGALAVDTQTIPALSIMANFDLEGSIAEVPEGELIDLFHQAREQNRRLAEVTDILREQRLRLEQAADARKRTHRG